MPELNPGLKANEVVSPENLHTEPPFQRPVYEQEPETPVEEVKEEKVKEAKKPKTAPKKK